MKEAKAGARLYRGAYGTPGSSGWDAPLKPKASSSAGAFMWGKGKKRRVFGFGPRALPLALDAATLVSKGPTALGSALTDAPELAGQRATELVAPPVVVGECLFVAGLGRAQNGRIIGAFITEIEEDYSVRRRLPRVDIPSKCEVSDFVVGEKFCVMLVHRIASDSGPGMLGTLFGKKQERASAPQIDSDFGSLLVVVPRDGGASGSCRLPGELVSRLVAVDDQGEGELRVVLLTLGGRDGGRDAVSKVKTSTLADSRSARLWTVGAGNEDLRVRRKALEVNVSTGPKGLSKTLEGQLSSDPAIDEDLSILHPAKSLSSNIRELQRHVCTVFNHSTRRAGLAEISSTGSILTLWTVEEEQCQVTSPLLSEDSKHVSVLVTCERSSWDVPARLMVFDLESIDQGPVHVVELEGETFGTLGCSVGGSWKDEAVDWSEEGSKPVKSAYEIFDSKRWNDIDSGFSSLGLGQ